MTAATKRVPALMTVEQAAERFGVCGKTIRRWAKAGHLPVLRIGRTIRISEDDAVRFVAAHRA